MFDLITSSHAAGPNLPRRLPHAAQLRRRSRHIVLARVLLILLGCVGALPDASAAQPDAAAGIVSRIRREPVESRGLAAVGYSKRLRALEIEFRRGGTYRYLEVPRSVYLELLAAKSKAGFYNRHVRGKYRSVYVRPPRKK